MKPRARRRRHGGVLRVVFSALAFSLLASGAVAGGMAVIDASNLTQNTMTALKTVELVKHALEQVKQLTDLNGAVGAAKASVNSAVSGWSSGVTTTVSSVKPNFDSWGLAKNMSPSINSPTQATQFLEKALDRPRVTDGQLKSDVAYEDLQAIIDRRNRVQREVAFRSFGIAQSTLKSLPDASQNANNIVVKQNSDLREQTAILIEAVSNLQQEQIKTNLLLSSLLELDSSNTIRQMGITESMDVMNKDGATAKSPGHDPFN